MTTEDIQLIEVLKKLPLDYWDFKKDDVKEYTHGIHNYPAMMVCPISRNIIRIMKEIRPVNALLDPFAGSGTVLVEGMIAGIPTVVGSDINPLALMLSRAKTTRLDTACLDAGSQFLISEIEKAYVQLDSVIDRADDYITRILELDVTAKKGWGEDAPRYLRQFCEENGVQIEIPDFKNIGYWFKPHVILELAIIKSAIQKIEDSALQDYFCIAFAGIQQRHIQNHNINTLFPGQQPPLLLDFFIISAQTVYALDIEQIVFFSFRSSFLYWGRSKSLPDCLSR